MREAAFLSVLVLGVALAQEPSCYTYFGQSIYCSQRKFNCAEAQQSLEGWCDARLSSKINAARENNAYLLKRALALDLTTCLQARTQADCSAKKNCFWFRGNDCIPRDLVP